MIFQILHNEVGNAVSPFQSGQEYEYSEPEAKAIKLHSEFYTKLW